MPLAGRVALQNLRLATYVEPFLQEPTKKLLSVLQSPHILYTEMSIYASDQDESKEIPVTLKMQAEITRYSGDSLLPSVCLQNKLLDM